MLLKTAARYFGIDGSALPDGVLKEIVTSIANNGFQGPLMYIIGSETTKRFVTQAVVIAVKMSYGGIKFLLFDTTKFALRGVKQILALSAVEEKTTVYEGMYNKNEALLSSVPFSKKSIGFGSQLHMNKDDELLLSKNSVNIKEFGSMARVVNESSNQLDKEVEDEEQFIKWYKSLKEDAT